MTNYEMLEKRFKKLTLEKSSLELIVRMMNNVSQTSGISNVIEKSLLCIMDMIGATNIILVYKKEDQFQFTDVYGEQTAFSDISDVDIKAVFDTGKAKYLDGNYQETEMLTPIEDMHSFTWIYPLKTDTDVFGVIKLENTTISSKNIKEHLPMFFNYIAHILKNEIQNYRKLEEAFEKLNHTNHQLEEYQNHLEEVVEQRTKKLAEQEEKFRSLIESTATIPWEFNLISHQYDYVGPQTISILGYPCEYWQQDGFWRKIIHPEDRNAIVNSRLEKLENGDNFEQEYRMLTNQNEIVWIRDSVTIKYINNRAVALQGFLQDITKRKQQELAIENMTKAVSSGTGQEFFNQMVLHLGKTLDCNYATIAKYDPENQSTLTTLAVCHEQSIIDNYSFFLFSSPNYIAIEEGLCIIEKNVCEIFPKADNLRQMNMEGYVGICLKDSDSNPIGVMSVFFQNPIKEVEFTVSILKMFAERTSSELIRLNLEKNQTKLKNYLRNIINSMPSILIGVDINEEITQWNNQAEIITGIKLENAIGKKLHEVLPDLASETSKIHDAISSKTIHTYSRETSNNDTIVHENLTIFPLVTNGVEGAVIRIDDTTKQHQLEEQVRQSQKMDAIGQLAGGIAHDFNNMIGGILGSVDMLEELMDSDEKTDMFLSLINNSAKRAAELSEKLLTFSRREPHDYSTPVDILAPVKEVVSILQNTVDKRIEININAHPQPYTVIGDPNQLQSMFLNLGINASHAMPDGGALTYKIGVLELESKFFKDSNFDLPSGYYVHISIEDTGTGIPPEILPRIFEPFFTTKEKGKGTGLGLAGVYSTVVQHRGMIAVNSAAGTGTCFHIYLPLAIGAKLDADEKTYARIKGSGRILLVDDEPVMRTTGTALLTRYGYDVTTAENGHQALEILDSSNHDFKVVVLDMIMPVMNGRDCYMQIKEKFPHLPVILASGFTRLDDLEELKQNGLFGFIRKPFKGAELNQLIGQAIKCQSHK
jgi:PAS domain S-box-containing protein